MTELIELLNVAVENKPAMGSECNHCGYCCLTEVCPIGQDFTGKTIGPCELLVKDPDSDKHFCKIALSEEGSIYKDMLGIGAGCCAETQAEAITRLTESGVVKKAKVKAKTSTERSAARDKNQKALGRVGRKVWATPDEHKSLGVLLEAIRGKRDSDALSEKIRLEVLTIEAG